MRGGRQREVLRLLAEGYSNPEIAKEMLISVSTTKTHVEQILKKMKARNRTHAAYLYGLSKEEE